MTVVIFPDTVAAVIRHLTDGLAARGQTVPVRDRVPNPRPVPLVMVRRLGGPRRDVVTDGPQITVECWAADNAAAHDLAQLCRGLVNDMPDHQTGNGVVVYRVDEMGGPAALPDPLTDHPRYVFTTTLAVRGRSE